MSRISKISQLASLQSHTIIYAVIFCVSALLIALLVSWLIPWKGGGGIDRSYIKRRVAAIVIGILACIVFFLYYDLHVKSNIESSGFQTAFESTIRKGLLIIGGGYVVVGLIIIFLFPRSKFGSIIFKRKKN